MSGDARINWPARFHPDVAPVHVRNELDMAAPPEKIWAELIRATAWPTWYPNARNVKLLSGGDALATGVRFRWTTFGATIVSEVAEFIPPSRIAWTGKAAGIDVYHAWLLTPSPRGTFRADRRNAIRISRAPFSAGISLAYVASPSTLVEALERRAAGAHAQAH